MNIRTLRAAAALAAMLLLILLGPETASAAGEGVELCIRTVIPALFPFFVLSVLLTGNASSLPVLRPLGKLFRVPPGGEPVLLAGLLGGYPVGADAAARAVNSGVLTREQGNRMLLFCSQAGPAFIFGILPGRFSVKHFVPVLWMIQLFSAWVIARLCSCASQCTYHPGNESGITFPGAVKRSVLVMANICGWIVLFRMLLRLAQTYILTPLPSWLNVFLCGIAELTNGCLALDRIAQEGLRFILCSILLSLGGGCVLMQTLSVTAGLDIRFYLKGKLLQAVLSGSLSALYLLSPPGWMLFLLLSGIFLSRFEKRAGNQDYSVV